jgi:6-phosphofructokinase 2
VRSTLQSSQTIVTATPNPSIDVSTAADRVAPHRKIRCDEPKREPGGGGLNVSRAIMYLGGATLALWARGGLTGAFVHELLDREGVPHRPIVINGLLKESFSVLERSSGRQFRFSTPGPRLRADELMAMVDELTRVEPVPAIVVGSGGLPPGVDDGFYAQLGKAAVAVGCRFVLDTHGVPLRRALDSGHVYLIKPNRRELGELVGRDLERDADVVAAARQLVSEGACEVVVASLGAAGACLVTRDVVDRIVPPAVPVRSDIGAGDSAVAGIVLGLVRGEPLGRAVRFGVAAGTAAVMTDGTELCRRQDVERLLPQIA